MPGAGRGSNKAPITDQISELQRKIALLDGDRKAYYESSQWTMKKNRETIAKQRKENKSLHKKLADSEAGDEKVINKAFSDRNVERAAMRGKSGRQAISIMDQKVCESIKKLNSLKSQTEKKERKLAELKTQHGQMTKDATDAGDMDEGSSDEAQKLRALENRLDKANLKLHEAEHINRTYNSIKAQMLGDAQGFGNNLDDLEKEIERQKEELKELKEMNKDAQISRDAAKAELARHEETVYAERKKREEALNDLKKQAEEKKLHAERVERRLQRASIQHEDLTPEQKQAMTGEEQERKICTYEEAFNAIKEATGVSDLAEVVARFESQEDTTKHLEELKKDSEKQLARLREEKEKLQKEFEEMKYSGEAKLSSGQRMLEDFQSHLGKEEGRREDAFDKLDRSSKLLVNVKAGVEHLSDKLQHLKASKGHVPQAQLSPSSDEYVLDLLSQCEEKLLKLMEELDSKDLEETLKSMEEEEFHGGVEGNLPQYNTRVKLPTTQKDLVFDDDDESGDDEDVITRSQLKRQAQQIVDSKTKKHKVRSRKKKTKS